MEKLFAGLFLSVLSLSLQAVEMPTVRCEMIYTDQADAEAFEVAPSIKATTGAGTEINKNGFTLNAKLEEIRVGCGFPTVLAGYSLVVTLSDDTHSSMISANLDSQDEFTRYSFSLTKDGKTAFVNCDHT